MKFKFDSEIKNVISEIAKLPSETQDGEISPMPSILINQVNNKIKKLYTDKQIPDKQYAKIRRQISFLFELLYKANRIQEKIQYPDQSPVDRRTLKLDKFAIYKLFMKDLKDIVSEKALESVVILRLGFYYGVVFLSDYEIEKLIKNNR